MPTPYSVCLLPCTWTPNYPSCLISSSKGLHMHSRERNCQSSRRLVKEMNAGTALLILRFGFSFPFPTNLITLTKVKRRGSPPPSSRIKPLCNRQSEIIRFPETFNNPQEHWIEMLSQLNLTLPPMALGCIQKTCTITNLGTYPARMPPEAGGHFAATTGMYSSSELNHTF